MVIALAWGVIQVFVVPPLQVPDEADHWFRAWAVTDGQFVADANGNLTLPPMFAGIVALDLRLRAEDNVWPLSLDGQPGFSGYEALFDTRQSGVTAVVGSSVRNYNPVGYLPQAVGVAVGRLVGASPLACFYLARLANLLAAVGLVFLAIRLMPFAKHLVALVALLPMTLFEFASASCDALTLAGAFLFIALLLRAATWTHLGTASLAAIVVAAGVLLDIKPGYWALALLVLLLRPGQVGGGRRYAALLGGTLAAVAGATILVARLTSAESLTILNGGSRLGFIVGRPLEFLGIVWSNLPENLVRMILQGIGVLGWLDVGLPPLFYAFVIAMALVFVLLLGDDVAVRLADRALLAAIGVVTFLLIMASLYAFLRPPADTLLQGRYFGPVWLLLLLSIYGVRLAPRRSSGPALVAVGAVMMAVSLQTLVTAYHG